MWWRWRWRWRRRRKTFFFFFSFSLVSWTFFLPSIKDPSSILPPPPSSFSFPLQLQQGRRAANESSHLSDLRPGERREGWLAASEEGENHPESFLSLPTHPPSSKSSSLIRRLRQLLLPPPPHLTLYSKSDTDDEVMFGEKKKRMRMK